MPNPFIISGRFSAPFIHSAPQTVDPTDPNELDNYYQSLNWTIQANATQQYDGISFVATQANSAELNLLSVCSGKLRVVPQGLTQIISDLPIVTSSTSCSLVLTPEPEALVDYGRHIIPGMPVFTDIIYRNVQGTPLNDQLKPYALALADDELINSWNENPNNTPIAPHTQLTTQQKDDCAVDYVNRVVIGEKWLPVDQQSIIGTAYLTSNGEYTFELYFRMCDGPPSSDALTASPIMYLRRLPDFATDWWGMHPAILAVESLPLPLRIYAKFRTWNTLCQEDPNEAMYVNVDQGITVKLMHYRPFPSTDLEIGEVTTDANGIAFFDLTGQPYVGVNELADIYFWIDEPTAANADLPDEWSTKDWQGVTSNSIIPGFLEDFLGTNIGSLTDPVIYRIGVDYHFALSYVDPNLSGVINRPAPKGIKVQLIDENEDIVAQGTTNSKGLFHGVTFDVPSFESQLHLKVTYVINNEDAGIVNAHIVLIEDIVVDLVNSSPEELLFPPTRDPYEWTTADDPLKHSSNPNDKYVLTPTVGVLGKYVNPNLTEPVAPWGITALHGWPRAAFYVSKILTEWATLWRYFTNDTFVLPHQVIHMNASFLTASMNLVVQGLYLRNASDAQPEKTGTDDINRAHFDRGTMFHELTHTFVWLYLGTEISAAWQNYNLATLGGGEHKLRYFTNPNFAFLEGFPEFAEALSDGNFTQNIYYRLDDDSAQHPNYGFGFVPGLYFSTINPTTLNPVSPIPLAIGNKLEGAFRNVLYLIFKDIVCDNNGITDVIPKALINWDSSLYSYRDDTVRFLETDNGNLLDWNTWMSAANKPILTQRFQTYFLDPIDALTTWFIPASMQVPDTTSYFDAVLKAAPATMTHVLLAKMARFNCFLDYTETPLDVTLDVTSGTANTVVTITSTNNEDIFPAIDIHSPDSDDSVDVYARFGLLNHVNVVVISSKKLTLTVPTYNVTYPTWVNVKVVVKIRTVEFESNAVQFLYS